MPTRMSTKLIVRFIDLFAGKSLFESLSHHVMAGEAPPCAKVILASSPLTMCTSTAANTQRIRLVFGNVRHFTRGD